MTPQLRRQVCASLSVIFALCVAAVAPRLASAQAADVPYVPTPMIVVEAMLNIAKVGPDDFLIDLGSGDGRIVITAATKYGARGFGVDLDGALVSEARREAQRRGVNDRVEFYARNLFITDIDRATVLTSYLFPRVNMQLRPRIFNELRPGTRVVSHEFDFGNWKPDGHVHVAVPGKRYGPPSSEVYLWIVPANAAGEWRWHITMDGSTVECELALAQTFQMLEGSARAGGRPARLERAKLEGDEIFVVLVADVNGREVRQELSGRIRGDTIRGTARVEDTAGDAEWQATRVTRGKINIDA
ncbi:MAG TPA: methyltransferase domain-containing protein [Burkholderiales bacterium]